MVRSLKRGDVVWTDVAPTRGNEQAGRRPVLIVSGNVFNSRSKTVIAMAITSKAQKAGFPLTLELKLGDLPKKAWVKIGQVRTLSIERLDRKIGSVSDREIERVIAGLNEIINS